MKKTLALLLTLLLALALLSACACAEGILPVLQTPPPELTETLSFHQALNFDDTPSASTTGEGGYRYTYAGVGYAAYQKFGQALAQEGFALTSSEADDEGTLYCAAAKDGVTLQLDYNCHTQYLNVTYPPRVLAKEADAESPYIIDAGAASILPPIPQVISLPAVTGSGYGTVSRVEDGYSYSYYSIPYECYARFSVKLGEAGFSLVSSGKTDEGYDRAVVTDGQTQLTIDYDQEGRHAWVTYPVDVCPRVASRYDDYEPVAVGDAIPLAENVTARITGWEKVDYYVTYYYDNNWIPFAKYFDSTMATTDEIQRVLVYFEVEYRRPEDASVSNLLRELYVWGGDESIHYSKGELTSEAKFSTDSDDRVSDKQTITVAVGFGVDKALLAQPGALALTFTDWNYAVPYAFIPQ